MQTSASLSRALIPWWGALAAILGAPTLALGGPAEEKKACLSSYESAQELRRNGSLLASREQMAICARPVCPKSLAADCTRWIEEVQSTIPTVVIEGRDRADRETTAVRVLVDGKPLAERLDGRAIEVDPGPHAFRFEHDGKQQEQQVVIREGERNRKISVSFAPPPAPAPSATAASSSAPPPLLPPPTRTPEAPDEPRRRPIPALTYAFGGVSLLGFAGFAYFGLTGRSKAQGLERDCLPRCSDEQVQPLKTSYLLADVALGVGLLAGGLTAISYAMRPVQPAQSARITFDLAPSPHGGSAWIGGKFLCASPPSPSSPCSSPPLPAPSSRTSTASPRGPGGPPAPPGHPEVPDRRGPRGCPEVPDRPAPAALRPPASPAARRGRGPAPRGRSGRCAASRGPGSRKKPAAPSSAATGGPGRRPGAASRWRRAARGSRGGR
ncbi:MAG: hypothetical protein MUF64_28290 [Polyangiaceae bacterium]|nr:hypothetical protein [Polyangiaceae bacterium]